MKCHQCGKVTQADVPWARPGSGFTLLMDALVLTLAKKLPVSAIAQKDVLIEFPNAMGLREHLERLTVAAFMSVGSMKPWAGSAGRAIALSRQRHGSFREDYSGGC